MLIQQDKRLLLLPCDCLLKWDDVETSLILCKKHCSDYENIDMRADTDYNTEQFIRKVIDPSGSQYSTKLLKELR